MLFLGNTVNFFYILEGVSTTGNINNREYKFITYIIYNARRQRKSCAIGGEDSEIL